MNPWIILIIQYGIPTAFKIWQEWKNKTEPTEEDWQKLLTLAKKTTEQYLNELSAIPGPPPVAPPPGPLPKPEFP